MNKNNQELNLSCLNCMYEYVCDWKYTNEELSCDKWQSDKDGDLSNKRITDKITHFIWARRKKGKICRL